MFPKSFIHCVTSLTNILEAALAAADDVNCVFGFAVKISLDVEFFFG